SLDMNILKNHSRLVNYGHTHENSNKNSKKSRINARQKCYSYGHNWFSYDKCHNRGETDEYRISQVNSFCEVLYEVLLASYFVSDKATIDYELIDSNTLDLQHTNVPNSLQGKGVGKIIAKV
ncbi:Protein of unknown function, partial [Gryllus bimaculatus]